MIITVLINDEPYYYDTITGKVADEYGSQVLDEKIVEKVKGAARELIETYGLEEYVDEPVYASNLIEIKTDMEYYIMMAKRFAEIYEEKVIPVSIKTIELFESLARLMTVRVKEGTRKREKRISSLLKIKVVDGRTVPVFECCVPGLRDTYNFDDILEAIDEMSRSRRKLKKFLESVADRSEIPKIEKLYNALEIYAKLR